ncbi:prephenate dehydratase [Vibrio sp. SS-MA-C1-2]|uniref:prephenate dehydratase n=1 Tax=Vibrio sp. SS-MA-C1-2 TaxID=2908646 RepID=UPI001F1E6516|nr:prephenate dehydratase [Vibrio sp. SS-MA-C1-2]UJF18939.1 prephenate dehydratase [Vibrio sp. SS-MA-C1-2]
MTTEQQLEPSLSLNDIRQRVSEVDQQILTLLAERRQISLDVAKSKIQTQKKVRDVAREHDLLLRLIKSGEDLGLDKVYVTQIFNAIIADSVLYQQSFLQQTENPDNQMPTTRVAFLGSQGSYSNLASRSYFSRKQTQLIELSCPSFKKIIRTVEEGNADYGVLPIENTSSGSINEVYDVLQHTSLSIVGEITQPIDHCLLTTGETTLNRIKTLYSHPQPHQQCSEFISTLGNIKLEYCPSTAEAMEHVKHLNSLEVAAIGNATSGELYGLTPLQKEISNQNDNFTRFIIVARKPVDVTPLIPAKTTLIMSTGQKPGSLVEALMVFRNHEINMTKLESRPVMGNPWEEMFYVDTEINLHDQRMQIALKELNNVAPFVKVLGCYPIENVIPVEI